MEERAVLIGAVAAVTLRGRGLRSAVKLAMRGVVAANEATAGARRELEQLYAEAKEERSPPSPVGASADVEPGSETAHGASVSA